MPVILLTGTLLRLARRASMKATEDMRKRGIITDRLQAAIMLYTDDPTTAGIFYTEKDMADICGVSEIEDIAIIMGEKFPPASFEAERDDLEMPRIAALGFLASGCKCPRCRKYTVPAEDELCVRCGSVVASMGAQGGPG